MARQLKKVTRPDGKVLDYAYDEAGRLTSITTPTGVWTESYFGATPCNGCGPGKVRQIVGLDGVSLAFTFDGSLQTSTTWAGGVSGSVRRTYTNQFQVANETVASGSNTSSVDFTYDGDGVLRSAGAMTLGASSDDGQFTDDRLGNVSDFYTYNAYAELADQTSFANGVLAFRETFDNASTPRDGLGRIVQKMETLQGVQTIFRYTYDLSSRLSTVTTNGTQSASYVYDLNGNRLSATTSAGTDTATYDDQDRLLTYGGLSYSYTANGELETKTDIKSGNITAYAYDVFGNVKRVDLPNGDVIEYQVDGQNRRVSRRKNGILTRQWLYRDQFSPVAEFDGAGVLLTTFVYASGKNTPDYMIQNGNSSRIFSDQLGSPRLVVDAMTGALKQRMRHDEFGNVLEDTNPGLSPFGFGGGLYDSDTGLVRFGARDYDPAVGRWISKDPTLFQGGINLYGYVVNDPVNRSDRSGLDPNDCSYYDARCTVNGGSYYCSTAPYWCKTFGHSQWANCTRDCLQDCDATENPNGLESPGYDDDNQACTSTNETPNNNSPFTDLSNFHCHESCYLACGLIQESPWQSPGPQAPYGP